MKTNFWAPMRTKCFAALLLSVALFGCGSKGSNSPATYPISLEYGSDYTSWCVDELGPTIDNDTCITYFVQDFITKLYFHYRTPGQIFASCFDDGNGNYGIIRPINQARCLDFHSLEAIASQYGVR